MVTISNKLPKSMRLRGRKATAELFERGQGGFVYPLRYVCRVCEDGEPGAAVLFTVSKKYHKRAVKRNLLKRRMREAFRTGNGDFKKMLSDKGVCLHIALLYSSKEVEEFEKIADAAGKILARIGEGL